MKKASNSGSKTQRKTSKAAAPSTVLTPAETAALAALMPITSTRNKPNVLVVDDEPNVRELFLDLVADCHVIVAADLAQARKAMSEEAIDVMFSDVNLPDGDGSSLVAELHEVRPGAAAILMTGRPTIETIITAFRGGAVDYLAKPFSVRQMKDRLDSALKNQSIAARNDKRLTRLKTAVRQLNKARRTVSQKVDLLCNDLIAAYGDVAAQMTEIRVQESFRTTLAQAHDLEQLLCHGMDWLLKQAGYSNIAVWLTGDENVYDLGAYMKYTVVGEKKLTNALKDNLLRITVREGFVHLSDDELREHLSPAEKKALTGQTFLAASCVYLGEPLGAVMMFRDGKCPFTDDDAAMLKGVAPIFASFLASVVRKSDHELTEEDIGADDFQAGGAEESDYGDEGPKKKNKRAKKPDAADWWKRGESPPF